MPGDIAKSNSNGKMKVPKTEDLIRIYLMDPESNNGVMWRNHKILAIAGAQTVLKWSDDKIRTLLKLSGVKSAKINELFETVAEVREFLEFPE